MRKWCIFYITPSASFPKYLKMAGRAQAGPKL